MNLKSRIIKDAKFKLLNKIKETDLELSSIKKIIQTQMGKSFEELEEKEQFELYKSIEEYMQFHSLIKKYLNLEKKNPFSLKQVQIRKALYNLCSRTTQPKLNISLIHTSKVYCKNWKKIKNKLDEDSFRSFKKNLDTLVKNSNIKLSILEELTYHYYKNPMSQLEKHELTFIRSGIILYQKKNIQKKWSEVNEIINRLSKGTLSDYRVYSKEIESIVLFINQIKKITGGGDINRLSYQIAGMPGVPAGDPAESRPSGAPKSLGISDENAFSESEKSTNASSISTGENSPAGTAAGMPTNFEYQHKNIIFDLKILTQQMVINQILKLLEEVKSIGNKFKVSKNPFLFKKESKVKIERIEKSIHKLTLRIKNTSRGFPFYEELQNNKNFNSLIENFQILKKNN